MPSPDLYAALFDAMPLGVTVTHFPTDDHRSGILVAANRAASEILGIDLSAFIDVPTEPSDITDDFDQDDADAITQMSFEVAVTGSTRRIAMMEIASGPAKGRYQSNIFAVGDRRAASVFHRIDNEHEAQRALDWAMQSLESANGELTRFASKAAHDLKNPMAGISGHAELLSMTIADLPDIARESVTRILELSAMSATMIDDLLRYSRQPSTAPSRPLDLTDAIQWAQAMLSDQLTAASATISIDALPAVYGNVAAVRQVMLNLMSNAIRYRAPQRPLTLRFCSTQRDDGLIQLDVIDNGIGIPEAERSGIFDWGRRGAVASSMAGSGIGLAACRSVMANLGGDIWVGEPVDSAGTTMSLTFAAAD